MNPNVLIVGAGQLGSRYLQGLAHHAAPLSITVVDPSTGSLSRSQARWREVSDSAVGHVVQWCADLRLVPRTIDLVIVSTSADARSVVVEQVAESRSVRYWVLEKVLAQSGAQVAGIVDATALAHGVWVNTPRRMMQWHQTLRGRLSGCGPVQVRRGSNLWGLVCNSIHFIDLVAWWTGETLVAVDCSALNASWFESKRPGFYEATGVLSATYSGGSTLRLEARADGVEECLSVATSQGLWHIDEATGLASDSEGTTVAGAVEFQSAMTARLVESILQTGHCELPMLNESAQMHRVLLGALLAHWNRSQHRTDDVVPIT